MTGTTSAALDRDLAVTQYIEMPCPQCGRGLRVRTSYVGLRLACKYCRHNFQVTGEGRTAAPPSTPATPDAADALRRQTEALELELGKVKAEVAVRESEYQDVVRQLQTALEDRDRARAPSHDVDAVAA